MAVGGLIPEVAPVTRVIKGAAGGERAGMVFTRAGKAEIKAENIAAHDGKMACELFGRDVVPSKQSKKDVTPPGGEVNVDHVIPKSKNGNGSPDNGQVARRDCNIAKGNKHD